MSILWSAGHETGDMSQWYSGEGGGEFNSGIATSVASTDVAHSGSYSAKLTASTPPTAGVRLFRWKESRANPQGAYYSCWFYFPRVYSPAWWNIFQFKARTGDAQVDPFWFLQIGKRANGNMYLYLTWWNQLWPLRQIEGPHQGEFGGQDYHQTLKDVPTAAWMHIEVYLRQSSAFDGQIIAWQDGEQLFNLTNIRTTYPASGNEWSIDNYSDQIEPSPTVIYIDDAVISTSRVWPGPSGQGAPAPPTNLRIVIP
jgi:hypothetical protein